MIYLSIVVCCHCFSTFWCFRGLNKRFKEFNQRLTMAAIL